MEGSSEGHHSIEREAAEARSLPSYQAVNGLWLCLIKITRQRSGTVEEHERVASMLRALPRKSAQTIVEDEGVDRLLGLSPPLEMILDTVGGERGSSQKARRECLRLREKRTRDPKAALAALFEIIQRVRDKREHGFKTPNGPRDAEILEATASILNRMVQVTIAMANKVNEREPT